MILTLTLQITINFNSIPRNVMSFGRRIRPAEALKIITGETGYSTRSLLNYYRPLYNWLIKEIIKYRIPVGW